MDGSKGAGGKGAGSRPQAEKRAQYVRLIAAGVNNSKACRIVGIHRKTGTRWRYGRTIRNTAGATVHYPPVPMITEPRMISARYLSIEERTTIADLHRAGQSVRAIARELGRAASVVGQRADVVDAGPSGGLGQQQGADRGPGRQHPGGGVAGRGDQV